MAGQTPPFRKGGCFMGFRAIVLCTAVFRALICLRKAFASEKAMLVG
jgi:hypothetical protein